MPRAPLPVLLLVLGPSLAGCTWFGLPPAGGDAISPWVVREAYVVPDAALRVDSPYGNLRAGGPALAVPVRPGGGDEAAAVYLGPQLSFRADAIFKSRERPAAPGDVYVQPPLGEWAGLRAGQNWTAASAEDLSAVGFADAEALFRRVTQVLPRDAEPSPRLWFLNGTVAAKFDLARLNISIATAEPPFAFQRNASGFLVLENLTLLTWQEQERKLVAQSGSLIEAQSLDPELGALSFTWDAPRVDVRIRTPAFREADLEVTQDPPRRVASAELPRVARVSMVGYASAVLEDNRVELRSQNVTILLGP